MCFLMFHLLGNESVLLPRSRHEHVSSLHPTPATAVHLLLLVNGLFWLLCFVVACLLCLFWGVFHYASFCSDVFAYLLLFVCVLFWLVLLFVVVCLMCLLLSCCLCWFACLSVFVL